jgi:hypothetical protein
LEEDEEDGTEHGGIERTIKSEARSLHGYKEVPLGMIVSQFEMGEGDERETGVNTEEEEEVCVSMMIKEEPQMAVRNDEIN